MATVLTLRPGYQHVAGRLCDDPRSNHADTVSQPKGLSVRPEPHHQHYGRRIAAGLKVAPQRRFHSDPLITKHRG
jgi:hypothetical protein